MRTLAVAAAFALLAPAAVSADATPSAVPASSASPALAPPVAATVHMHGSTFVPATVTIHAGQSVRFVNDDDVEHDATAANGSFASPELDRSQSFAHTFDASGTVPYGCNDHAFMHGTIVVLARTPA